MNTDFKKMFKNLGDVVKPITDKAGDAFNVVVDKGIELNENRGHWFYIHCINDNEEGYCEQDREIFIRAKEMGMKAGTIIGMGCILKGVYGSQADIESLMDFLGSDFSYVADVDKMQAGLFEKNTNAGPFMDVNSDSDEKIDLDEVLKEAVSKYNAEYTIISDYGVRLFTERKRAIDLLQNVEDLVNSIANHPKKFDADIQEINIDKKSFDDICDYAKMELEAAQKSAVAGGAGVAGGMAVASLAPSAAMWIATTFGTASTGTAISALSGAAAENAALAWLGGGAVAAGGGGTAAGTAFLALAGPIGWGLAGATLLASVALFANNKLKLSAEKKNEIASVLKNTEQLKEYSAKIKTIYDKTIEIREGVNNQYSSCLQAFGKSFLDLDEDMQLQLGTLVNNAKALAAGLQEGVND